MPEKPSKQTDRLVTVDPLGRILDSTLLESGILANFFFSAPWAVDCGEVAQGAPFHAVVDGTCLIRVGENAGLRLNQGDLVLMPRWTRHVLASAENVREESIETVFRLNGLPVTVPPESYTGPLQVIYGGDGTTTHIFSGVFYFRDKLRNPILNTLPDCVHFKASEGHLAPWLDTALRVLGTEASDPRPGYAMMVKRLADLLLVEMLRSYLNGQREDALGWLSAMSDPRIGRALRLVHGNPGHKWTLERLARESGLPRSSFAAEFRRLVGEAPLQFITSWRMHLAADGLIKGEGSISSLAAQLGYESEISFSKAFKRKIGVSPGQYRERHRRVHKR